MKYIKLNTVYSLRNESTCSYIIRKNMYVNYDLNNYQRIYPIPPFLGYIFAHIGQMEYDLSIQTIGKTLNVDFNLLKHFLSKIIEQPSKSLLFLGEKVVFPDNLLVKSRLKDCSTYYSVHGFSPMNAYIICRPHTPISVNFMVTERCNTNCIYCYAKRDTRQEMSTSEILKVLKELSNYAIVNLTLTGGDIFARKDWYEIISHSKSAGFGYLISTKTTLRKEDIIKLKQLGIHQLQFSLDTVIPSILREMINADDGYYDRLKVMFHACTNLDIKVSLRTVLCGQNANIDSIRTLCDFVNTNNCISNWVITPAFYSENKRGYNHYAASNEMLKKVFSYLQKRSLRIRPLFNKLNKDGYILQRTKNTTEFVENNQICYANTYSMSILPTGDCTVCEMLYYNKDFILGNLKDMSVEEIWNSEKALWLYSPRKEELSRESACSSCKVFDKCKNGIAKRVCYVDVMKVHKHRDFPDPKCPQSQMCDYIL